MSRYEKGNTPRSNGTGNCGSDNRNTLLLRSGDFGVPGGTAQIGD